MSLTISHSKMTFKFCFLIIPKVISTTNAVCNLFLPFRSTGAYPRLPSFIPSLCIFRLPFLSGVPGSSKILERVKRGWLGFNSCSSNLASCVPRQPPFSKGSLDLVSRSCQNFKCFLYHLIKVLKVPSFSKLITCLPRKMPREC